MVVYQLNKGSAKLNEGKVVVYELHKTQIKSRYVVAIQIDEFQQALELFDEMKSRFNQ